jgi:hypothetical protein
MPTLHLRAALVVGATVIGTALTVASSDVVRAGDRASSTSIGHPPGKATVSLKGEGVDVTGEFATRLCGDAYMLGEGMSYQVRAGDWQITVASETRSSGDVPLNTSDGSVNIVVTANGPGRQFVRSPAGGGSLKVGEDYMRAEADLELRAIVGPQKARLQATFTCTR